MGKLEFRPLRYDEEEKVGALLRRNNMPFDSEFVIGLLKLSNPPKTVILGCFQDKKLIGLYSLYEYKLFFSGSAKDAAIASFITIDKGARGQGLGQKLIEELARYAENYDINFITAFIDEKLGKWRDVINNGWKKCGYQYRLLGTITPCYRPHGTKIPQLSMNELKSFYIKRLSVKDMGKVIRFANTFYSRYYIAALPDQNTTKELELFPDKYLWFSIGYKDKILGYISCFRYRVYKKNRAQEQIHFNHLMVDDIYLPSAVNGVVAYIDNLDLKPDLYAISNTSVINNIFLYKAGFRFGFSKFHQFLRCRSEDPVVMDIFQKIDGSLPFALSIL